MGTSRSKARFIHRLRVDEQLREAELPSDLNTELVLHHGLRPDDMVEAMQVILQHLDENLAQVKHKHRAEHHVGEAVDT